MPARRADRRLRRWSYRHWRPAPGVPALAAVFPHRVGDGPGDQSAVMVRRQRTKLIRSEAHDLGGPVDGPVPLIGQIKHGPFPLGKGELFAGHDEGQEIGFGAAAGEHSAGLGGKVEKLLEPVEDENLHLGRPGRFQPGTAEKIVAPHSQSPRTLNSVGAPGINAQNRGWSGFIAQCATCPEIGRALPRAADHAPEPARAAASPCRHGSR